jgi:hypothetical protein
VHRECFESSFSLPDFGPQSSVIGEPDEFEPIPPEIAAYETPGAMWPAYDVAADRVRAGLAAGDREVVEDGLRSLWPFFRHASDLFDGRRPRRFERDQRSGADA